jgi:putative ABC transport system permease protein
MSHLRLAVRSLRGAPSLVVTVVLTYALAIGANAAMVGLVSRLMLPAPPGVAQADRVARVSLDVESADGERFEMSSTSYPVFEALRSRSDLFASVAAVLPTTMIFGARAEAREVSAIAASGAYFSVLGARVERGRFFSAADDELPMGNTVAVLSYSFWQRRFGGDHAAIGRQVLLGGQTYEIIGVAAPNFSGDGLASVDVFVPLTAALRSRQAGWWAMQDINLVSIIARLRQEITPAAASAAATAATRELVGHRARRATVELQSLLPTAGRNSQQARIALWLLGVSIIVLVIATANVGTLLLQRAMRRRRDVAVRMALGASRARLAAQLTTESALLSMSGGAVGLIVSHWLAEVARATLLPTLAPSDRLLDARVLWFTLGVSVITGIAAGVAPIFFVGQRSLTAELQGAGTFGSPARARTQRVLVGFQVALCTVLLVGAGLFVRSLQRVRSQELGFSTAQLLHVQLETPTPMDGPDQDDLHVTVARSLERTPGVTGATVVQAMPFGSFHVPPISIPGLSAVPTANGQPPFMYGATPTYLRLMGVTPVQGRLFTERDRRGSELVVLVNESMAREIWPGQSAVGKCMRVGHDPNLAEPSMLASSALPCRQVVGVVRDSRARSLRPVGREASQMQYYVPFGQLPPPPAMFVDPAEVSGLLVGVSGDLMRMAALVQSAIQGGTSASVYARVRPYQDLLDPQMRPWRLGATLFVLFGALALTIAAIGLFGVISYLVTQRTREIGLRLALGATGIRVGGSVVLGAMALVGAGVAVGLASALVVAPRSRDILFETSPFDAAAVTGAAAILLLISCVAAALPAWRAARVSPMTAMRMEQG